MSDRRTRSFACDFHFANSVEDGRPIVRIENMGNIWGGNTATAWASHADLVDLKERIEWAINALECLPNQVVPKKEKADG